MRILKDAGDDCRADSTAFRRQKFSYHDLTISVVDSDKDAADDVGFGIAERFYLWNGKEETETASAIRSGLWHTTMVVNRMTPGDASRIAELFAELDTTDFPEKMGTRRRQLWHYNDVYFHLQDFEQAAGTEVINQAWRDSDSRFIKICDDLESYIRRYDPETWARPADSIAKRIETETPYA
ncbi:TcmI family type II polyketide cyclase [Rhodococcus sp. H29-C3]|uniref:TcmI family type II polyketide cyclase n=1 Tax=Rhodococcus sp. H29-C3 TaxID=3046307 RepID=UPI0024BA794E|nr:TcmI family type II polyketide cyclase [Rhodococcus sp. H29-C3]MDJ0362468.1 TcmI family type II polyketide cyclase [Rhodococcus sp. H29-C3]